MRMLVGSVAALAVLLLSASLGVRGGETLLDQSLEGWLLLFVPLVLTAVLGIAGGAAGLLAVVRARDRSVLLALPVAWAIVVLAFALGEALYPH